MTEEQKQEIKRRKREKKIERQQSHKNKYLPLFNFLKKNGLKFKNAVVEKHTVEYFRMDNFMALLEVK